MKLSSFWKACLVLSPGLLWGQYTAIINSNRPGLTVGAYSVGSNVFQIETGIQHRRLNASDPDRQESRLGIDLALRYGLFFETLEVTYEGGYVWDRVTPDQGDSQRITDFTQNRAGLKWLVYDPFRNPERNQPNIYSWRKNNLFQWRNLIPAVSLYGGANLLPGENPFYPDQPQITYRAMIVTQSILSPRLVLSSNVAYDRITSEQPEWNVLASLSHALSNPAWSVFGEFQYINSQLLNDQLLRVGAAHLFPPDLQIDLVLSSSLKADPGWVLVSTGLSYRFDGHSNRPRRAPRAKASTPKEVKRSDIRRKSKSRGRKNRF